MTHYCLAFGGEECGHLGIDAGRFREPEHARRQRNERHGDPTQLRLYAKNASERAAGSTN